MRDEACLSDEDRQTLDRMMQAEAKMRDVYRLVQRFREIVRQRESDQLMRWIHDAREIGVDALRQFTTDLIQDLDAVKNSLLLPWSNGQVEGQIKRLKLIKRQMYGRAGFDLLRKRVLAQPVIA